MFAGQFLDGIDQHISVFFFHISQKDLVGNENGEDIFIHRIGLQGKQPRFVGYVGDIVIFFYF